MTTMRLNNMLEWRPNSREIRLLSVSAGVAMCIWLMTGISSRNEAREHLDVAQEKLSSASAQFSRLSDANLRTQLLQQSQQLASLRMTDPTPQIAEMRMQEELTLLLGRADFSDAEIVDSAVIDKRPSQASGAPLLSTLTATIEADFDWTALVAFIGEIEHHYRGYLIDGIETRSEGEKRRMRISLRTLHQPPETVR